MVQNLLVVYPFVELIEPPDVEYSLLRYTDLILLPALSQRYESIFLELLQDLIRHHVI